MFKCFAKYVIILYISTIASFDLFPLTCHQCNGYKYTATSHMMHQPKFSSNIINNENLAGAQMICAYKKR